MTSLVAALRQHATVEIFFDHFNRGTADDIWIPNVAARGWFIITRDTRIRWRRVELDALERSGAGVFVVRGKALSGAGLIDAVLAALPKIKAAAQTRRRPFVCAVHATDGRLEWKVGGKRRGAGR